MSVKYICFDFETNGLESKDGAIEIAITLLDKSMASIASFCSMIALEGQAWNKFAADKHGYTPEEVAAAPSPSQVREAILAFFAENGVEEGDKPWFNALPMGHNVSFDIGFMKGLLGADTYSKFFHFHNLCTMNVAQAVNLLVEGQGGEKPFKSCSLDQLRAIMGITLEGAHKAAKDVEDTIALYKFLIDSSNTGLVYFDPKQEQDELPI